MSDMPDYAIKSIRDMPDWRTVIAEDIDVLGLNPAHPTATWAVLINYTVPAGKTLLIYDWSAMIDDGDGQIASQITYAGVGVILVAGGQRGFQTPLTKPKRVAAGGNILFYCRHDTGADRIVRAHFGGILI